MFFIAPTKKQQKPVNAKSAGMWLLFAFLNCLLSLTTHSQVPVITPKFIVEYEMHYKSDTGSNLLKNASFVLESDINESRFYDKKMLEQDSIANVVLNNSTSISSISPASMRRASPNFGFVIHKNIVSGISGYFENFRLNGVLRYTDTFKSSSWKIDGDTGRYGSLQTIRATCTFRGRQYTAWFTPEIPIQDGPYKFCGLPGLIVEIMDSRKEYHFKMVSLSEANNRELPAFHMYSQAKDVTRAKFLELKSKFELNPLLGLANAPHQVSVSEESRKAIMDKALERQRKNNNPIELN
jgi:GLPGLI family protein